MVTDGRKSSLWDRPTKSRILLSSHERVQNIAMQFIVCFVCVCFHFVCFTSLLLPELYARRIRIIYTAALLMSEWMDTTATVNG